MHSEDVREYSSCVAGGANYARDDHGSPSSRSTGLAKRRDRKKADESASVHDYTLAGKEMQPQSRRSSEPPLPGNVARASSLVPGGAPG